MPKKNPEQTPEGDRPLSKAEKWLKKLEEVNSGTGSGKFFFPKAGRTRVRLLPHPDDPEQDFFIETESMRFDKKKRKFILAGMILATDKGELQDRWKNKVVPIVVSPAVIKGILSLLGEGYELLDWQEGHSVTIVRSGEGLNTSYSVLPGQKPHPVDGVIGWLEDTLEDLSTEYAEQSQDTGGSSSDPEHGSSGVEDW